MSSVNTQLFTSLKQIRAHINSLVQGDQEAIAKVGAAIEHLMTEYDAELTETSSLLILCLTALQKIYQDETADFSGITSAISAGLVATEQGVASKGNPICEAMIQQASTLLEIILYNSPENAKNDAPNLIEEPDSESNPKGKTKDSKKRKTNAVPAEVPAEIAAVESSRSVIVDPLLVAALKEVRQNLDALQLEDTATVIKLGAGMENLLTEFESEMSETAEIFMLCLAALQKMYHDRSADSGKFTDAIGDSITVAEQYFLAGSGQISETEINRVKKVLQSLLEESSETEVAPIAAQENDKTIVQVEQSMGDAFVPTPLKSLDDIGSLLIQMDSADKNDVIRICAALKEITGRTENAEHRKMLVKAARDLDKVVKGKESDAEKALAHVGEIIEQINNEVENQNFLEPQTDHSVKEPAIVEQTAAPKLELVEKAIPAAAETPTGKTSFDEDNGLLIEFIVESRELIEAAEGSLLSLENDPEDVESINTVFRAFHSVKGTSTFLGLNDLTKIAHHAESLLSRMRDREIRCTGGYANLALRSVDVIKEMLQAIEDALPGKPTTLPFDYNPLMTLLMNPEANGITGETTVLAENSGRKDVDPAEIVGKKKTTTADSSVRVRTDRLDSLIDMVGELVIAQSMLAQDSTVAQGTHHELSRKISHAGKIVRELQDLSMAMRMIPLKNSFQKMARIVRDVAQKCGKQIEFVTEGEDTEIDRNMVDIIADPLVHMVRNAADHGIEKPDVRRAAGKSPVGKIKLSAYHSGGDVVVELTDDGAGLDRDKLLAKAISLNLVESDKGMSENQIFNLIFAPGFSTAEAVTDVSGRGVGMDVVRRNIEAMRGRIEISSEKGKGSLFTIRLPLTLAITDGMLMRIGAERFIVPTINIHLSFRPTAKMISTVAGRGELVSLRGELMPIFRLHKLFEVEGAIEDPTEGLLMIVADGRRRCALMVDELLGQQQVVAKTLGQGLGKITGVSGGAILGDGCVGLILDLPEIVALARQNTAPGDRREEQLYHQAG